MTRKKTQTPYVKHFLSKHPLASAAQARFGELAWNAARDEVKSRLAEGLSRVEKRGSCSFDGEVVLEYVAREDVAAIVAELFREAKP